MAEPRNKLALWFAAAIAATIAVVAWFVYLEWRGPRSASGPAPQVQLAVVNGKGQQVEFGAKLSPNVVLVPHVTVARPTRVSLVHIDVGHGLEALVLNQPMSAGEHAFDADGGALQVSVADMSGPQKLAAVAADRDLTQDEALSAGRGTAVPGAGVSAFTFSIGP